MIKSPDPEAIHKYRDASKSYPVHDRPSSRGDSSHASTARCNVCRELNDTNAARLREARELRDDGIRRAADHAGEEWKNDAFALMLEYLAQHPGELFMTEDCRHWAADKIEAPPDNRAWGHVALRAAKGRYLIKHGYGTQKDPKHHMSPGIVWRIA